VAWPQCAGRRECRDRAMRDRARHATGFEPLLIPLLYSIRCIRRLDIPLAALVALGTFAALPCFSPGMLVHDNAWNATELPPLERAPAEDY
jgi:hypothetical protein